MAAPDHALQRTVLARLTDRLAAAFKLVAIPVSQKAEEEEENELLEGKAQVPVPAQLTP